MSGRLDVGLHDSGACAPEDIDELLEAAGEFERAFEVDSGLVLRELAQMLRRQAMLQGLRKKLDRRS